MAHNFGEKKEEYSVKQKTSIPVWMSPKYEVSKAKAIEIIDSKKYGLEDGDFWILMNETKNGKMAYTGLITSHNACLKINDALEDKFKPSCVTLDKDGYANSLVYTYINDEQGIYEVGEVSAANCKQAYPYAMAYKRLFDRVVLKLSKLAYAGVYSEAEAAEFKEPLESPEPAEPAEPVKGDALISPKDAEILGRTLAEAGVNIIKLMEQYKVASLDMLTDSQRIDILRKLNEAKR